MKLFHPIYLNSVKAEPCIHFSAAVHEKSLGAMSLSSNRLHQKESFHQLPNTFYA